MVRLCFGLIMLFTSTAWAVDVNQWQQMANDPEAMQKATEQMMKQMTKASECAGAIDFEKMQAEGQALQAKIKTLCDQGNRKGAEKAAMDYSKKMLNSSEYKQLKKCGEQMASFLPADFMQNIESAAAKGAANEKPRHICDL